jgi:steroid delta-isomerase-like uncharacterized protein
MTAKSNQDLAMQTLERAFNQGDIAIFDEVVHPAGVDHQAPVGTDMLQHLKQVVPLMRTGFPDLHFEVHHVLADGEIVAFHSTMTGTHLGPFNMGPFMGVPPTGKKVSVRHMHFLRWQDGKNTDLWHLWDTPSLMRQLGVTPQGAPAPSRS